jgi:hypothetical protein
VGVLAVGCVGGDLGREIVYFGGSRVNTPIWDVLALQGEQEGLESVYTVPNLKIMSQLGKRCQLGLLELGFAAGLIVLGFS